MNGNKDLEKSTQGDLAHNSTDADIENGIDNRLFANDNDLEARRNSLSKKLEDVLVDTADWLELSNNPENEMLLSKLEEAHALLGKSIPATDDVSNGASTTTTAGNAASTTTPSAVYEKSEEEIDKELKDSFPASDPPANY